ncbi:MULTISPECIES: fumarylacetoacetate hydrolase family protein [unclassified Streptomyces]|uniref:fumarylacetoacetate hydrolase family protein n=1 Tax=unclassified Streptomyces TaxID=2593676 RepID=UPI00168B5592|nr:MULTISPECIES: fumarylacetoacetate hydrolase family protein [unclassified Streptomyces]MBD3003846.1 fumarylacetoacetate hydrolase family protein [Streptomyces sp. 5-10]
MRTTTRAGRMCLVTGEAVIDVEQASAGRFPADPLTVFEEWDAFRSWAAELEAAGVQAPAGPDGSVSPTPRQVFAIGLNYRDHAEEAGLAVPESPSVFTKFATSLTGPDTQLRLPGGRVDWEAELVVVMGRRAEHVAAGDAWSYVAGLTVGQDYSERDVQSVGPVPQFSLGKSFPGFAPTGPVLVTADEFADPDDLAIECLVNGESVQKSRTSSMIFPVPELIARLSAVCPLLPGDLIFTGTPSGVGHARTPQRYLRPGDEVVTRIEGIGQLRQTCLAA